VRAARALRRALRAAPALALAAALAGCGDPALWARWRAERGAWRARLLVERLERDPHGGPAAWARARAACRAVPGGFPAAAWTARARAGSAPAFDVLAASGRAALLLARLDDLEGRPTAALEGYARMSRDYAEVPAVALEGAVARARLLARAGMAEEVERAWTSIARDYPPADPRTGAVLDAVLDAPLRVAADVRARGDARGADSVLRAAELIYRRMLPAQRGRRAAPELWERLAEARAAQGDGPGALAALRGALADPAGAALAPRLVLELAGRALAGVGPDTALAYARWAADGLGGDVRAAALLVEARAWRARGAPDSALALYERMVEEGPDDADETLGARFERARLLEDLGRWDQARGEYHALSSLAPTHALGLEAMLRVVRHYLGRGETPLGMAEARQALETLDGLAGSQQDDSVQVRVGQARARLRLETGDPRGGCGDLAALLRRYPEAPLDAGLLAEAAGVAETRLADAALARQLYRAAAVRAAQPELRRRARTEAERLAREGR